MPGSNDKELLALVTPYLVPDVDEPEWDTEKFGDAPIATPLEALQQIFSGEVPDVEWGGGPYYEAVSTLYMHFATTCTKLCLLTMFLNTLEKRSKSSVCS